MWTSARQAELDACVEQAVLGLLGIRAQRLQSMQTTFSGGVALDRALAAVLGLARARGAERVHVVTCSPSIDIIPQFLGEHESFTSVHYVETRHPYMGYLDEDRLMDEITSVRRAHPHEGLVVILTSPENPTGEVWSEASLAKVGDACAANEATLIVDHAYLLAGVHDPSSVPGVWNVLPVGLDWIGTWDTGKTFGLNDDKLGFIFSGSERTSRAVEIALSTLQYAMARRQKLVFARLLGADVAKQSIDELRKVCRRNLAAADRIANGSSLSVRRPAAGSVALLKLAGGYIDEDVRRVLLAGGVGVVAGRVFFHTNWQPPQYVRIALARSPEAFDEALMQLVSQVGVMT
jgi:aspartate/methionine/tyrosine aminotransferase